MSPIQFATIKDPNFIPYQELLNMDPQHPHVHLIDMPFRITSTWLDQDCEFGIWQKDDRVLAWAVFQPPWRGLDYAIHPLLRGSSLEKDIFAWGKEQMQAYARRTGDNFCGVMELFADTPDIERTEGHLADLGFEKLSWSDIHFGISLHQEFPALSLPAGYTLRPSYGRAEVQGYVDLVQAVFGSGWMTNAWRLRTLAHPAYHAEMDLVVADSENTLVGFCLCWLWQDIGQIEPLGVHPEHQGLGLGRALELAALAALQKQGARMLYVDHGSINERAVALSIKTGFRQSNDALRYCINILGQP